MCGSLSRPLSPVQQLCRDLVRIPSPSGEEGPIAAFVADRMAALGFQVERDPLGTVLGRREGHAPGPVLLLDAHLDTVPPGDQGGWRHGPHAADIAEGRLWGRGSADTKGSLAAMLCAAASLSREAFRGTLLVSASVGEEDLTAAALGSLLDRHRPDLVIVGEPTELRLGVAQKGRAGLVVEAAGRTAHTSRPELGLNAVYTMLEAIARIRALPLPMDPELGPSVCELIEIASEPRPSPGMVPDHCAARFALRLLPGEGAESILERYSAALQGLEGITLRLAELSRRTHTGHVLAMPEFIPGWRCADDRLKDRLLTVLGTAPFAAPYTTNASAAAARGIPTFLLGPGSIEQAHTADEWIALDQLEGAVEAYRRLAGAFFPA